MYAASSFPLFMSVCMMWWMHVPFTYLLEYYVDYASDPIITFQIKFHYTLVNVWQIWTPNLLILCN